MQSVKTVNPLKFHSENANVMHAKKAFMAIKCDCIAKTNEKKIYIYICEIINILFRDISIPISCRHSSYLLSFWCGFMGRSIIDLFAVDGDRLKMRCM